MCETDTASYVNVMQWHSKLFHHVSMPFYPYPLGEVTNLAVVFPTGWSLRAPSPDIPLSLHTLLLKYSTLYRGIDR